MFNEKFMEVFRVYFAWHIHIKVFMTFPYFDFDYAGAKKIDFANQKFVRDFIFNFYFFQCFVIGCVTNTTTINVIAKFKKK